MLVNTKTQNPNGQEIYQNNLTGAHGTLAGHLKSAQKSERSSRRDSIYKTYQPGAVNNNRKRTKGRKIHVIGVTNTNPYKLEIRRKGLKTVLKRPDCMIIPMRNKKIFIIEHTKIIRGKEKITKEHREVLCQTSKRMTTVPQ